MLASAYLLGLLLDPWIFPDGSYQELDWDEFEEAVCQIRISPKHQHMATQALRRMVAETHTGHFPWNYILESNR